MTFCIITHVVHSQSENGYFGYAPYVNEMNIWFKQVDKVIIVAPLKQYEKSAIHEFYKHQNIEFVVVPEFSLISFSAVLKTIFSLPKLLYCIYLAMKKSHHIHLRCPGNMGLLGSIVQILFPNKKKTAKYAGNWDAKSSQPTSYKLQKYILSNTFLSKNMKVLVYGEWKNQSKNIVPFFTATYAENEKKSMLPLDFNGVIKFLFVGSLVAGKNPLYAIKIVEELKNRNYNVQLSLYGEGTEKKILENYILQNTLSDFIFLRGNRDKEYLKNRYSESHFLLLPSKSEGWPKVVAEAMFWCCLPVATPISCVPTMLDYGKRGILISEDFETTVLELEKLLKNHSLYVHKTKEALLWSRQYTLDQFEIEIKKLLE